MVYADFTYYQQSYIGTDITEESTFRQAAERASDYLDAVTFGRLESGIPPELDAKVRRCCCALAEAYAAFGGNAGADQGGAGSIKSESVGAYSVTYASSSERLSLLTGSDATGLESYLQQICGQYLGRTGLLYRGCD